MSLISLYDSEAIAIYGFKKSMAIYWSIIMMAIISSAAMPFVMLDVAIRSTGIVRPITERTGIRSMVPGIISQLNYKDGDYVEKDKLILTLRNNFSAPKILTTDYEINERSSLIHDLELIIRTQKLSTQTISRLQSAIYRKQVTRYLFQLEDHLASVKKVQRELATDSSLFADKVISAREFYDKKTETEKLTATYDAFKADQLSIWQQDLLRTKAEQSQLHTQKNQLFEEHIQHEVRAPVAGILQGLGSRYEGGYIQAGETICELSPETDLIAECFVESRNIGFLRHGLPVTFQIDAFDYNYFGTVTGKILSIDNDYTILDNKPAYKVRCLFDKRQLSLKNGYSGHLKKGFTLQARFVIARRSVSQLLFDKIDDWLNPGTS
ncbi:MAG TPA: HlyD family secretion protein [Flavitalea sp.]|nr:HlyD family secretion protein [Flavitalea sp.]